MCSPVTESLKAKIQHTLERSRKEGRPQHATVSYIKLQFSRKIYPYFKCGDKQTILLYDYSKLDAPNMYFYYMPIEIKGIIQKTTLKFKFLQYDQNECHKHQISKMPANFLSAIDTLKNKIIYEI